MVTGALLVRFMIALPCLLPNKTPGQIPIKLTACFLLQVDEEQRPMSYTQVFQLMPDGQGSYFVFNDVFRFGVFVLIGRCGFCFAGREGRL